MDESQLIARVRAGDSAAERALYDAHVDRVYRLAFRLAGDDALAQDFTQETFIRAFDRLRHAEPDLKARLKQAIDDLPEGYRTVFLMHDVEGYTHEEIGVALGVETGTSKAQLSRARAKLRVALSDFAGEWVQ
ncbi:MAG: hypothetical protein AUI09_02495 [Gemmatimonadetes bacterium 13_2_20CM_2_66_5]|nr:MAG: hypothetical protein AUI09_02495 [Gemmatimonadetes bacterium 13_2_20CM_2_66_5]